MTSEGEKIWERAKPAKPLAPRWLKFAYIGLVLLTAMFAITFLFNGGQGAGYLWFVGLQGLGRFLAWSPEIYAWPTLLAVLALSLALRYMLPQILVPILGGEHEEPRVHRIWYRRFELRDDMAVWKEGKYMARANRAYIAKATGLLRVATQSMERHVDEDDLLVTYEAKDGAAYRSGLLLGKVRELELNEARRHDRRWREQMLERRE